MAGLSDILSLLDKIPIWKRLTELPAKVEELEKRISALEERPLLPICPSCGVGHVHLDRTEELGGSFRRLGAATGASIHVFKCDKCGMETKKRSE